MTYGTKYRLDYCNKEGIASRLDIEIRDYVGAIEHVAGTTDVFSLEYQNENDNKTGYIISSFADIKLYEHPIDIDSIKTFDETAIRISYYIGGALRWQGFALPDFFETEISNNAIVSISATDRLSTLKEKVLSNDNVSTDRYTTLISLIAECLKLTGLSLPIRTATHFVDRFSVSTSSPLEKTSINKQRLTDDKGRNISAFDVLRSILIDFNCYVVQRNNEWWIVNKYELENVGGRLYEYDANGNRPTLPHKTFTPNIKDINLIAVGGRRAIQASAFEVSIYGEYGGLPLSPYNYDFNKYLTATNTFDGWASAGTNPPAQSLNNKNIESYNNDGTAIFGTQIIDNCIQYRAFLATNPSFLNSQGSIRSNWIELGSITQANFKILIEATSKNNTVLGFTAIIRDSDNNYRSLHADNDAWYKYDTLAQAQGTPKLAEFADEELSNNDALTRSFDIELPTFDISMLDNADAVSLKGCQIQLWLMGSSYQFRNDIFIHNARLSINSGAEAPKGTISKVQQVADFSKKYDTHTTIFSDYVKSGVNGYFYNYPNNDTSILYRISNNLVFPLSGDWQSGSSANDYLIMLATRQMSRLFSSARDVLTIEIDSTDFDILDVYRCANSGKQYVATSLTFDFFKSTLQLVLEENVLNNTTKKDFLYSYFGGDNDDGISGIGGIGGGGSGGGGGSSAPQYWQLDENGNLFTEYNAYSLQELSAYGLGDSGGGGGGTVVIWGTEANNFVPLTVEGISKTVALLGHTHSKTEIGLGNVLNVASYSKIESDERFAPLAGFNSHVNDNIRHITSAERVKWDGVVTDFEELEIGGRNLLTKSSIMYSWNGVQNVISATGAFVYTTIPFNKAMYQIEVRAIDESMIGAIFGWQFSGTIQGVSVELSNNWQRAYVFCDTTGAIGLRSNRVGQIELRYIKAEYGNIPTDWTPAPEDQVSDWLTTDVNSFSFIKNKPTLLSQFTDNIGVATHIANTSNPHSVTKVQVGLGNVDNTSDLLKPISTAMQTALNGKVNKSGDTMTGNLTVPTASIDTILGEGSSYNHRFEFGRNGYDKVDFYEYGGVYNFYLGRATHELSTLLVTLGSTNKFTNNITAPTFIGALSGNATTATTATNLSRSIVAGNGLTGGGVLNADRTLTLGTPSTLTASTTNAVTSTSHTHAITTTSVGLANTIVQTDTSGGVRGAIIRIGASWTLELVGTELQIKYNGVLKQRFLSDGSFVAVGEITAYE